MAHLSKHELGMHLQSKISNSFKFIEDEYYYRLKSVLNRVEEADYIKFTYENDVAFFVIFYEIIDYELGLLMGLLEDINSDNAHEKTFGIYEVASYQGDDIFKIQKDLYGKSNINDMDMVIERYALLVKQYASDVLCNPAHHFNALAKYRRDMPRYFHTMKRLLSVDQDIRIGNCLLNKMINSFRFLESQYQYRIIDYINCADSPYSPYVKATYESETSSIELYYNLLEYEFSFNFRFLKLSHNAQKYISGTDLSVIARYFGHDISEILKDLYGQRSTEDMEIVIDTYASLVKQYARDVISNPTQYGPALVNRQK